MAELQLAVLTPIDELRNREIKSNIKDLLPMVQEKALEYKNTTYGIEQEKMCREHRALLNKFRTSVADEVKAIGEANNTPFERFQAEVQPIIDIMTDTISSLDAQIAEMEAIWRTRNMENAKALYDAIIGGSKFASWIPWEKILITKKTSRVLYEDFFGNKGSWSYPEDYNGSKEIDVLKKAGKKITEVFDALLNLAQERLDVINSLDYSEEIKFTGIGYIQNSYDPVKRGFDNDGAMRLMADMSRREREKREAVERAKREAELEKQKAILEERRKAEEEKRKAVEEDERKAKEEAEKKAQQTPVQMKVTDFIPNAEEKKYVLKFEAEMTITQAKQLRAFCDSYGITLKKL